jgi:L-aspartate oxidase
VSRAPAPTVPAGAEETAALDVLIVGSGVAGLSAAVAAADVHGLSVGVLTKGEMHQTTTRWAQGGVAAVLGEDPDSTDLHLADTVHAGAGLCDVDAVRVMVDEGPARVHGLIALGAVFDTDPAGGLALSREGGHSHPRILHAGGAATGTEIERALVDAVQRTATVIAEHSFAVDLAVEAGRCVGIEALDAQGRRRVVRARHTLLAAGGSGQLFSVTTNPAEATGDGVAMAIRAGVPVADVEFVQFHPTALHHPAMPRPLLSEALRGHGALLRDATGERFVDELQPRDIVSRAIMATIQAQETDHVWLDATGLADFASRFPTIAAALAQVGLDPARDWLPVAPAAHYHCGGIVTDLDGATALPGLWAAGEVSCVGVHGANRLASNSLLDGMVFSIRAIEAIDGGKDGPELSGAMRGVLAGSSPGPIGTTEIPVVPPAAPAPSARRGDSGARPAPDHAALRRRLQQAMTAGAGVLRSGASLAATSGELDGVADAIGGGDDRPAWELRNLVTAGRAVLTAAELRHETRGAHTRLEFPERSQRFLSRFVLVRGGSVGNACRP